MHIREIHVVLNTLYFKIECGVEPTNTHSTCKIYEYTIHVKY